MSFTEKEYEFINVKLHQEIADLSVKISLLERKGKIADELAKLYGDEDSYGAEGSKMEFYEDGEWNTLGALAREKRLELDQINEKLKQMENL